MFQTLLQSLKQVRESFFCLSQIPPFSGELGERWRWPTLQPDSHLPSPIGPLASDTEQAGDLSQECLHGVCKRVVLWLRWEPLESLFRAGGPGEEGGCLWGRGREWAHSKAASSGCGPLEGLWNVLEPSGEKWSVAESSWTLWAPI